MHDLSPESTDMLGVYNISVIKYVTGHHRYVRLITCGWWLWMGEGEKKKDFNILLVYTLN